MRRCFKERSGDLKKEVQMWGRKGQEKRILGIKRNDVSRGVGRNQLSEDEK